jgi:hypothetical protein
MIFEQYQHLGDRHERTIFSVKQPRCYLTTVSGGTTTNQTAYNQQTSAQGSGSVTGSNNTGVSNVAGTAVQGNNNNVSITTADPAIVNSALESNSLVATEALSTYDHLVTGQTAGQQQSLLDTLGAITGGNSQPAPGTGSDLSSGYSNPVPADTLAANASTPATDYTPIIFIAGAALVILYFLSKK